jgi:hypothetical protein
LLSKLLAVVTMAGLLWAGPVEFGRAELERAFAERKLDLKNFRIKIEVAPDPPESYRIVPGLIAGGDLRGLMYGLIEAAEQIRKTGHLRRAQGTPAMSVRGVRVVLTDAAAAGVWVRARARWPDMFRTLALNRFNRFNLVLPGLGMFAEPGTPAEAAPGQEPANNLDMLRLLSETAADYGVDFTLGLQLPGAMDGPSVDASLAKVLEGCPSIRSVELHAGAELAQSAIHAVLNAGRRVTLEVAADSQPVALAARNASAPLRLFAPYPGGPPPSATDQFFWEVEAPPDAAGASYFSALAARLARTKSSGFEIDLPPSTLAQSPPPVAGYLLLGRLTYEAR